ncbi:MAG: glycosyltransferase [Rickettsiales bacterium]|nr:glycosyltransferase [Rickettsiales bacterium]
MNLRLQGIRSSNIFGLKFYSDSYDEYLKLSLKSEKGYSCFCNSHMLYEYMKREGFNDVLNGADFILPDGMPLLYSIKLFNNKKAERIAGNDVVFSLVNLASSKSLRMFWIGGDDEVLSKISQKLTTQGVIHQVYSPPFLPIEEFNFDEQEQIIKQFQPDIILVGLGCPKQEIWMHTMNRRISAHMYGVGGAFLLYAGVDRRAPKWMRDIALEWVYRFALEPRRLFKRYFVTNTYFCYLFVREFLKRRI